MVRRTGHSLRSFVATRSRRGWRQPTGPKLLRAFADVYPDAFFVEIGANDGEQGSALREFVLTRPWSGIMVEPAPAVFERLSRNYSGIDRVSLENAAISDRDGHLPFFHLREADDPTPSPGSDWRETREWRQALGSLSRDQLLRHAALIPDIEDRIVSTEVPGLAFESLCRKHHVQRIDLLVVDTEGHDYEIVRQIDFDAYRPRLLIYEHLHLQPADRRSCRQLLEAAGYELMEEFFDTYCLDTGPEDALTRKWRRSRPALAPVYAE